MIDDGLERREVVVSLIFVGDVFFLRAGVILEFHKLPDDKLQVVELLLIGLNIPILQLYLQ